MDTRTICKEGICLFGGSRVRVCPAVVVTVADTFLSTGFPMAYFDLGKGNRMVDEIKALKELFDMGAITQEEFDKKKAEILAKPVTLAQSRGQGSAQVPLSPRSEAQKSKVVAGLLAIFLGGLGIHKFYLGYTKQGVIMLLVSLFGSLLLFIGPLAVGVIALIEGIMYLTKSDEDFDAVYVQGERGWF